MTRKVALDVAKAERAVAADLKVQRPRRFLGCWARVKQPSTGSARSRYAPRYANCTRFARPDYHTCTQHQRLEDAAQALDRELSVGSDARTQERTPPMLEPKTPSPPPAQPEGPRAVAFIPDDGFVPDHGWRVAFVREGEAGYRPTGNWPYHGHVGEVLPWFWGFDRAEAERRAEAYNTERGLDKETVAEIILRSMFPLPPSASTDGG